MGWFEQRRRQRYLRARQKAWRRKQEGARCELGDRTAEDIARQVAASELRKRIKIRDQTKLAHDIEELDDLEKLLLTLGAEGLKPVELSRYLFEPLAYVMRDLEGIIQRLREGQERAQPDNFGVPTPSLRPPPGLGAGPKVTQDYPAHAQHRRG